jgi:gp41 replication and recombination DNA helicase|nr:MAG TPA: DnaB-like replicative helicase [Caudoviricetes sp.]
MANDQKQDKKKEIMALQTDDEVHVLAGFLHSDDFIKETIRYFKPDFFEVNQADIAFTIIKDYFNKYQSRIPLETLTREMHKGNMSNLNEEALDLIAAVDFKPDEEWLNEKAEDFCRRRMQKVAVHKLVNYMQEGFPKNESIESVTRELEAANIFKFQKQEILSLYRNKEKNYEMLTDTELKVPTGYHFMDSITSGGVAPGSLCGFAAASGGGKTLAMCSLAMNYSKMGKKVLLWSLELQPSLVMNRLHSNILRTPVSQFENVSKDTYMEAIKTLEQKGYGEISVVSENLSKCNIVDLRTLVETYQVQNNFTPDVIIVDYMGLMKPVVPYQKTYEAMKAISEDLKNFARDLNVVVWTGVQMNRSAASDGDGADVSDVATSIDMVNTFDFLMFFYADEDDPKKRKFKLFKNRFGEKENVLGKFGISMEYQEIFDLQPDKEPDVGLTTKLEQKTFSDIKKETSEKTKAFLKKKDEEFIDIEDEADVFEEKPKAPAKEESSGGILIKPKRGEDDGKPKRKVGCS